MKFIYPAPPLQIPVSETGNLQSAPAVDAPSSTSPSPSTAGGSTRPSANNTRPFPFPCCCCCCRCCSTSTPSSSAAAPKNAPSPNLLSTSRNSPSDAGFAPSSLHSRHHLRRASDAAGALLLLLLLFFLGFLVFRETDTDVWGSRCWDGALKVMAGKLTPIRVPRVVLLSWKKDPVDCRRKFP